MKTPEHQIIEAPLKAEKPRCFLFDAIGVRVVGNADYPWFVAKDVCAALGIANYRDATSSLEDDEKGVALTDTLGGAQEMLIVNESGLYALIFRSRKTQAMVFRKWVTSEVLPAIRRTGGYLPSGHIAVPAEEWAKLQARVGRLESGAAKGGLRMRAGITLDEIDARLFAGDNAPRQWVGTTATLRVALQLAGYNAGRQLGMSALMRENPTRCIDLRSMARGAARAFVIFHPHHVPQDIDRELLRAELIHALKK